VRAHDAGRWLLLALLWSLQYLFLRVAVPEIGAGPVADGRALFGGLFVILWAVAAGHRIALLERWRDHFAVGIANNVLPFVLLSWAASVLPAGYLSIINGTVPLWTAVFAAWRLGEPLGPRRLTGFALGIAGVAVTVNLGPLALGAYTLLAALAGLAASALWGWAGVLIKQRSDMPAIGLAAGSLAWAALVMAPLWAQAPPPASWTLEAGAALLALGILCSGLAYLPFFTLVRDIGPSRTLSVGYIVPVLGVLWGWLLLNEALTAGVLGGCALVLVALALVLKR
jgi:drug/metabolite transporter (DMT)-like permease